MQASGAGDVEPRGRDVGRKRRRDDPRREKPGERTVWRPRQRRPGGRSTYEGSLTILQRENRESEADTTQPEAVRVHSDETQSLSTNNTPDTPGLAVGQALYLLLSMHLAHLVPMATPGGRD